VTAVRDGRSEQIPAEFGTGLLRTTVTGTGGEEFQWRRTLGDLAPEPFVPPGHPALRELSALPPAGGARIVLSPDGGDTRSYLARGTESAAGLLLRSGPAAALEEPLRGLGRLLAAVHACPVPDGLGPLPRTRALTRLGDWLAGRAQSPRAALLESHLETALGGERLARVREWYDRLAGDTDLVLVHGAPGLGSLVVGSAFGSSATAATSADPADPADLADPATPAPADLLTGEDVSVAPWYSDLGWVVGELVELKWYVGGDQEAWGRLLSALFDGYGRDLGPEWNRSAALRILLHLHDFTAYVGWSRAEIDRYAGFLRFLIDV
jgi:phosphopantothenoylcysteine decarboxylase/phosphopantothenate--cysteine ligase